MLQVGIREGGVTDREEYQRIQITYPLKPLLWQNHFEQLQVFHVHIFNKTDMRFRQCRPGKDQAD